MIAIIDYGAGNLFSVKNALDFLGVEAIFTSDEKAILQAESIILPGVGAYTDAMQMLNESGLVPVIKQVCGSGKPFLGICLGMQLLFEKGSEFYECQGLGLIEGRVDLMKTQFKIPHMGYNGLEFEKESPLLTGLKDGDCVYFVHSYMAYTDSSNVVAYCDYGIKIPALVQNGNVFGAQFHPEKSGEIGLQMLKNFAKINKNTK